MGLSRAWGQLLAGLAIAGLYLPVPSACADSPAGRPAPPLALLPIRDVQLARGGLLVGRLLDANGRGLANSDVSVLVGGKHVAATRSDDKGVFAVAGLRGGVHQIAAADNVQLLRLWAEGTAPPQAAPSVEIVAGSDVVRGQWGPPPGNELIKRAKVWGTNPFIVGGVVAGAVAIPIALSDNGPNS